MIMRTLFLTATLCGLLACSDNSTPSGQAVTAKSEAEQLGGEILAIKKALEDPTAPGALDAVTRLGHDSRYYTLVRGWLMQELSGLQSIADATDGNISTDQRAKQDFLREAIRAIDLE